MKRPERRTRLCVIVVTYRSAGLIERCLEALIADAGALRPRIMVVDNASDDGTTELVRRRFPGVEVIETGRNLGFAGANNVALRVADGMDVLFLNPDADVRPGAVPALLAALDADPLAGAVAPRLEGRDGELQLSIRNFPTVANQVYEALMLSKVWPRGSRRWGEVVCDPACYRDTRVVEWVSGAAFLVRGEALRTTGGFDERFFLYSEEKDLQQRLTSAGWRVLYCPEAVVEHAHGDTYRPDLLAIALRSKLAYFAKHFRGVRRLALEASLGLFVAVRIAAAAAASLVGVRFAPQRLRSYVGGARLLLATRQQTDGVRG